MPRPREPILAEVPEAWVGARVVVRPFREEDAAQLFAAVAGSREHLRRWLPWAQGYRVEDDARAFIRESLAHVLLRERFDVGIFAREGGEILGGTGFGVRNWSVGAFEIGYWITKPAEGRGYVAEAVKLLARFLFDDWEAQRVVIRCDTRNVRSAGVARRLGFTLEGVLRHDALGADGAVRDTMVFALTPADFAAVTRSW